MANLATMQDLEAVGKFARSHAAPSSTGYCAKYVRKAFQSRLLNFVTTGAACDYHNKGVLAQNSFAQIDLDTPLQVGDVYVINRFGKHRYGHIAVWDGRSWISDFVQRSSNVYHGVKLEYVLYRHKDVLNGARLASGWEHRITVGNTKQAKDNGVIAYARKDVTYDDAKDGDGDDDDLFSNSVKSIASAVGLGPAANRRRR